MNLTSFSLQPLWGGAIEQRLVPGTRGEEEAQLWRCYLACVRRMKEYVDAEHAMAMHHADADRKHAKE